MPLHGSEVYSALQGESLELRQEAQWVLISLLDLSQNAEKQ